MAAVAYLYRDARKSERYDVDNETVLHTYHAPPSEILIKDLSTDGFRFSARLDLPVGSEVGVTLHDGIRRAKIVWQAKGTFGCTFVVPLSEDELRKAIMLGYEPEKKSTPLSLRSRVTIIIMLALAAWTIVGTAAWIIIEVVAALL
jgi:hypothetical protein